MPKPPRQPKKKVKRRTDIERPYSNGEYSEAKFRSFAMNALRRARWGPKCTVISRAFVRDGINPLTGHKCKLHKCEHCGKLFAKGDLHADHVEPVIPEGHDWANKPGSFLGYDWNEVLRRMWVEESGFQVLCKEGCHKLKTEEERVSRAIAKAQSTENPFALTP